MIYGPDDKPLPRPGTRLRRASYEEFKKFWSAYRWWVAIVGLFSLPLTVQVVRHRRSMLDLEEPLVYSVITLVISLAGTYAIAFYKGAVELITAQAAEVTRLTSNLNAAQRNPTEEQHFQFAKAAVDRYDQQTLTVLRYLRMHQRITDSLRDPAVGPNYMPRDVLLPVLDRLVTDSLVSRTSSPTPSGGLSYSWEIAPGLVSALDQVLYK